MKKVLIAGIGNILLGDDGVGPYVVQVLESAYDFDEGVELADLGTPALDFIDHIAGRDALIVIDSVDNGKSGGALTLYGKKDLLRNSPSIRLDTHSPAITGTLVAAEVFFGVSPRDVLLIGISASCYDAGCTLSAPVQAATGDAVRAVLAELDRLGVGYVRKPLADSKVWWMNAPQPQIA
ncbi:MAG TPA: hydrogenase maturation protease [Terriglobales bacterium]|nr:hydrogenase maturation protease [Terriglobales bacterium]